MRQGKSRLDGKRALITGAGGGIGRATAIRLAAEGARVFISDLREEALRETLEEIAPADAKVGAHACDVGDEAQVAEMTRCAVSHLGGLDTVVTSAGMFTRSRLHELSLHDWDWVLRVNLTGMFLCARAAIPHLIAAGGGSITTVGSVSSVVSGRGSSSVAYKVSKAGVLQLARTIAVEYADDGIRANCVCPAGVDTDFERHAEQDAARTTSPSPPGAPTKSVLNLLGRRARAEEIAAVIAFLASDDASFVTGSAVMADGGFTAI